MSMCMTTDILQVPDDVIKWKRFPRCWTFVRRIHRSPVNFPHKGQWRGAMFYLICAWPNGWVINQDAGDLRRHHCDVTVICKFMICVLRELQSMAACRSFLGFLWETADGPLGEPGNGSAAWGLQIPGTIPSEPRTFRDIHEDLWERRERIWWSHGSEKRYALLALCAGNPPATGGFPTQGVSNAGLWLFFVVRWNKLWNQ